MQLVRDLPAFHTYDRVPHALTIGNFDGVHVGHQAMLARVVREAKARKLTSSVMSFWPSPQEFFGRAAPRIYSPRQKIEAFARAGVERVFLLRFNHSLSQTSAHDFIADILRKRCNVHYVLAGDDFQFGFKRGGNVETLRAHFGAETEVIEEVLIDNARVSSTRVRTALQAGDFALAARLLGRPFEIVGHVAHGQKLGRTLGFPTANVVLPHTALLRGVYAVNVRFADGTTRPGVASIGLRPTVTEDGQPLAEVFIFDFRASIYGQRIAIVPHEKLRDEEKFASVDAMTKQIALDVEHARAALGA